MIEQPHSFLQLCMKAGRHYWRTFKTVFLLIVLILLVKEGHFYFGQWVTSPWLNTISMLISTVVLLYLFSVLLWKADQSLKLPRRIGVFEGYGIIAQRLHHIYLACFFYIAVYTSLFFLARLVVDFFVASKAYRSLTVDIIFISISGLPFLFFIILSFMMLPIIILRNENVMIAFFTAVRITGTANWLRAFGVYFVLIVIWVLVSPQTLHGHVLAKYHLNFPFDFIVFSLFLPFLANLIIFSLEDIERKYREKKKTSTR